MIGKIFLLLLAGFSVAFPRYDNPEKKDITALVDEMRICFYLAVEDEDELNQLEYLITHNFGDDETKYPPKILAYAGGLEALKAKHTFNPISKLSRVLAGVKKLGRAVEQNSNNLEIRFLRFSVLHNLPGILGYGEERQNDLDKIYSLLLKRDYSELNSDVQRGIAEFMFESGRLSGKQKKELYKLFPELAADEHLSGN